MLICFLPNHALTTGYDNECTGCLQMNCVVSKVNKKFISHLTRAQRTPSAAATAQVSHTLPAVRFFMLTAGPRVQFTRWRRSPAVSTSERTAGSAWETWTVAATNGVRFARVRWEINFLLTFETAPFICKHPVFGRIPWVKVDLSQEHRRELHDGYATELKCVKV